MIESKLNALLGERFLYCLFLLTEVILAAAGITALALLFITVTLSPTVLPFFFHENLSEYPLMWMFHLLFPAFIDCVLIYVTGTTLQRFLFSKETIKQFKSRAHYK